MFIFKNVRYLFRVNNDFVYSCINFLASLLGIPLILTQFFPIPMSNSLLITTYMYYIMCYLIALSLLFLKLTNLSSKSNVFNFFSIVTLILLVACTFISGVYMSVMKLDAYMFYDEFQQMFVNLPIIILIVSIVLIVVSYQDLAKTPFKHYVLFLKQYKLNPKDSRYYSLSYFLLSNKTIASKQSILNHELNKEIIKLTLMLEQSLLEYQTLPVNERKLATELIKKTIYEKINPLLTQTFTDLHKGMVKEKTEEYDSFKQTILTELARKEELLKHL